MTSIISKITVALLALTGLMACSSGKDEPGTSWADFVVPENVVANGVKLDKTGTPVSINVKAPSQPVAEAADSWCKVSVEPASATIYKCAVSADPNTDTVDRETLVTVKQGDRSVSFKVLQTAAEGVLIETPLFDNVPAVGADIQVKLKSNGDVAVTVNDSWITPKSTKAMTDKTFDFSVAENPYVSPRTGTITFTLGDITETVTVKQLAGAGASSVTLADVTGNDPYDVMNAMGLGWNLGNQMDGYANNVAGETAWGNPTVSQKLFDAIAASGIKTVRIPVTWLGQFGDAPNYRLKEPWLNRVAEIVDYAHNVGLNVILNIHHDGADSAHWLDIKSAAKDAGRNEAIKKQIAAIWGQIAARFKDYGSWLVFETFNEIHDGGWGWGDNRNDGGKQYAALNEWNQTAMDAIRAAGGNNATRFVAVPGYCANPQLTVDNLKLPVDPANRTIVAIHFYDPTDYSLEAKFSEWGHTGKDKATWGDEDNVRNVFGAVKAKFIDKGIPVYIGEMGAVNRADARAKAFRLYYMEYVAKAAHDYGMSPVIWDNGAQKAGKECSGLFNRTSGAYYGDGGDVIAAMVKAVSSADASYTLESVYNSAPK